MKRWKLWTASLAVAVSVAAPAVAQEADAIERWRSMSPEQQAEIRERFERFQSLPPEARDVLRDRLKGLRERLGDLERQLGPDESRELDRLGPHHRGEALRDLLRERLRMKGQALRGELPPDLREGFDRAEPGRRPLWLEHNRERVRDHFHGHYDGLRGRGGDRRGGFGRSPREGFGEKLRERMLENRGLPGTGRSSESSGRRFEFLSPDQARELLEAGRPRLEEILERRSSGRHERPDPRGRILDAARRSGALTPEQVHELEEASLFELMLQLRETAEKRAPLGV